MADPRRIGPRTIRKHLLEDDAVLLDYMMSPWLPLSHAAQMAQVKQSADKVRRRLPETPVSQPEHAAVDAAMKDAADKADLAFDAAIEAAWKFMHLRQACRCESCRRHHQRENADLQ